jgi:hypothetical protein
MRITPSPALIHGLIWNLTRTLRFRLYGLENLRKAAALSPTRTFLVCHFHQSILSILGPHHHLPIATLASKSRDGEITTHYLEKIGIRVVRGSSSRGGAFAAFELMKALRDGYFAVINVDGPRGPFKHVKPGAVELARRCGVPIGAGGRTFAAGIHPQAELGLASASRCPSRVSQSSTAPLCSNSTKRSRVHVTSMSAAANWPSPCISSKRRRLAWSAAPMASPPQECLAWMDEGPTTEAPHPGPST